LIDPHNIERATVTGEAKSDRQSYCERGVAYGQTGSAGLGVSAMQDANYFLDKAEQCFKLSLLVGPNHEVASALQSMGNEFMTKAVEIDTERDRKEKSRQ
jgi:hypothetical protein